MAALFIQTINVNNGGTRTLLLILLILAVLLILAGALIAMYTFYYAYKHRASLTDKRASGEQG